VIATGVGLAGAVLALPVTGLAVLGGAATYTSVRSRYLEPLVRGLEGLEELLEVIAAAVKTGGSFLPAEPPRPELGDRPERRTLRP
jgi:hypothetical protein